MEEDEILIKQLNWRTNLWERKRDDAKRRVEVNNIDSPLAKIDLEVAEAALKRIKAKKREIWDKAKSKLNPVAYSTPKVLSDHTHNLSPEEAGEHGHPYAKVTKTAIVKKKKRVHKRQDAAFTLASVEEVVGESK